MADIKSPSATAATRARLLREEEVRPGHRAYCFSPIATSTAEPDAILEAIRFWPGAHQPGRPFSSVGIRRMTVGEVCWSSCASPRQKPQPRPRASWCAQGFIIQHSRRAEEPPPAAARTDRSRPMSWSGSWSEPQRISASAAAYRKAGPGKPSKAFARSCSGEIIRLGEGGPPPLRPAAAGATIEGIPLPATAGEGGRRAAATGLRVLQTPVAPSTPLTPNPLPRWGRGSFPVYSRAMSENRAPSSRRRPTDRAVCAKLLRLLFCPIAAFPP